VLRGRKGSVLRCLTLERPGANGVQCRQTPASDIALVKFGGSQALQFGATSGQNCGLNLGGTIWVGNNLKAAVAASSNARITVAANIVAVNPVSLEFFALSYDLKLRADCARHRRHVEAACHDVAGNGKYCERDRRRNAGSEVQIGRRTANR
jgi:hypothetical protein